MSEQDDKRDLDAVAIVGMSGRFPGAGNVDALWRNLRDGVEALTFFSEEELKASGVARETYEDPNYVPATFFLEDAGMFDAGFFGMNPREAQLCDPQQRLFLECAWEALEDAGYDPARYPGNISVYAGSGRNTYLLQNLLTNPEVIESMGVVACALANEKDFISTRVAYKLDLRGAAVTVQNACSTSLVGVHLGCQALLGGETDMVLAGGACVAALRREGYLYFDGGIFSPDGHLRAFDARAGGQVGGNGVAIVVLKRLEDALADGDTVRAVIRGSALNNDGEQKVSFSAPGVDGQARVIVEAMEVAGVEPESISYIETHGTGTHLGDPIEVRALTQAYRTWTDAVGFCPIGSLKTAVGHLDAAAGVAGLIKTSLALQHKLIPPSLNYEQPNPQIDFASSPFFVNTELRPWITEALPRRAGVSSFGMGGTNAHVIVEEAPTAPASTPSQGPQLLCVSARSEAALQEACARLALHLERRTDADLADVAYTTQVGRRAFRHRRVVLAADRVDAANSLRKPDALRTVTAAAPGNPRGAAFLFTGQGAQYPDMTRGIYETEAVFRAELDRCCELLLPHVGLDLRDLILPAPGEAGEAEQAGRKLALTQYTQPALFAVEYALAKQWMSWGVAPVAMAGHSIGEYTAACLAGVFDLEDAARIVAARGRLIGALPEGGGMLAVYLSEDELTPLLGADLSLAAINAPGLVVASGPDAALAALEQKVTARGVSCRRLHTSHAFHSALMEPMLEAFRAEFEGLELHAPTTPVVSCATGAALTDAEAVSVDYWVDHVRATVRFADCVETLQAAHAPVFLEVGPGQTLVSLTKLCAAGAPELVTVASTRHPKEERGDRELLLLALARLWAAGVEVDWPAFHGEERRRRVPLPTYPFEHQRYWVEPGDAAAARGPRVPAGKNPDLSAWFWADSWRRVPLASGTASSAPKRAVVYCDASGLGERLAVELGQATVRVHAGDAYEARADGSFVVRPGEAEDHRAVLAAIDADAGALEVYHAFCCDELTPEAALERGFYDLLALGQALAERATEAPLRVAALSTGMREVGGGELDAPEKAALIGPVKALRAELPGAVAMSLDVEADLGDLGRIVAELRAEAPAPVVALRGRHRWIPDHEAVPLAEPAHSGLRPGGVYLVTGGLGGIGLSLASHMAQSAQARLILTSRSGLPAREAWDTWIVEHGAADATSRRIAKVRALESAGAEVEVLVADVADGVAMAAGLDAALARFGDLHGVVHAAGLPGAGLLSLKTRDAAAAVLSPKVQGTRVLWDLVGQRDLDFVVLCSSLATAVTAVGQVDYFAANAFLDAFAVQHAGRSRTRVVALGWDAWREVGMAVDTDVPEAMRAAREEALATGISPTEGCAAFERALTSDEPHLQVSTREIHARIAEHEDQLRAPAETDAGGASPATPSGAHARPSLSVEYQAPEDDLQREVAGVWADLLGIDRVGVKDNFFELGGDSLLMMQLSVRVKTLWGVNMPIRVLFETTDVEAMAERIESVRALGSDGTKAPEAADDEAGETEEFAL